MPERKPEQEKEVLEWIQAVMEEPLPQGEFEEVIHYIVLYFCYLLQQFSTIILINWISTRNYGKKIQTEYFCPHFV